MSAFRAIAPAFIPPRAVNDNGPLRVATDIKHRRTAAAAADTSFDRNVIPFRRSKASLRSAQSFRAYDGLGQLLTNTGFWGPNNNLITASATYDSLGNIRSKGFGNRVVSLAYDTDNGNVNGKNRVVQSIDSQPAPIAGAPKISGEGAGGTGTRTVAYDNRGNVTSLGTMAFYYDYSDQPTVLSGTKTDGTSLTGNYRYDGHLKRVRNQVNGKTIYNVFDASGKLVHTRDFANNRTADYIIANGETVARWGKDHWIFDHQDHLGSTVAATQMNGNVNARIRYAPFGLMMDDPKKLRDGAGFTGHLKDSDTGLNYMQARYYDPVMGRFLSIDPVTFMDTGHPGMFNRYSYVHNDPVNMMDPSGLCATNAEGNVSCPEGIHRSGEENVTAAQADLAQSLFSDVVKGVENSDSQHPLTSQMQDGVSNVKKVTFEFTAGEAEASTNAGDDVVIRLSSSMLERAQADTKDGRNMRNAIKGLIGHETNHSSKADKSAIAFNKRIGGNAYDNRPGTPTRYQEQQNSRQVHKHFDSQGMFEGYFPQKHMPYLGGR